MLVPMAVSAVQYLLGDRRANWQTADRSSAGLLVKASEHTDAVIRVFAARTVRWRGIFAVHTWIVVKERGASRYSRYDYTAWGEPIRIDGFLADGRWFGEIPETVVSVDGPKAEALIPKIRSVIETYKFRMDAVPELEAVLPPTAIGKDYPYHGNWVGFTPSRTGVFASLGGYIGLTIGWIEGIELNFFGGVLGFDIRRPALKLPGVGRLGLPLGP
jgi:hypothetical protein